MRTATLILIQTLVLLVCHLGRNHGSKFKVPNKLTRKAHNALAAAVHFLLPNATVIEQLVQQMQPPYSPTPLHWTMVDVNDEMTIQLLLDLLNYQRNGGSLKII
jgi:sialic acid synthase SpsE